MLLHRTPLFRKSAFTYNKRSISLRPSLFTVKANNSTSEESFLCYILLDKLSSVKTFCLV